MDGFDGVLAFGEAVRELYLRRGWSRRAWRWHEAAGVTLFRPMTASDRRGDLIWIGNWGDGECTRELHAFLVDPVRRLRLRSVVHGVRYPKATVAELAAAGIGYRGWLANYRVSEAFSRFAATLHVPRGPYVRSLPGIPTIRVFEALACGIPLICAPWDDTERLFGERDYLSARDSEDMLKQLRAWLSDGELRREVAGNGLRTILSRHTCRDRVDELIAISCSLGTGRARPPMRPAELAVGVA